VFQRSAAPAALGTIWLQQASKKLHVVIVIQFKVRFQALISFELFRRFLPVVKKTIQQIAHRTQGIFFGELFLY